MSNQVTFHHSSRSSDAIEYLTETELSNPELVFQSFFEMVRLVEIKELLAETALQLTNNSFPYEKGSLEFDNTIYLFERFEKLIEAAYLMRRDEGKNSN